jgi:hypothetical protein
MDEIKNLVTKWREEANRLTAMADVQKQDRERLTPHKQQPGRFELELRERARSLRGCALDLNNEILRELHKKLNLTRRDLDARIE